MARDTTPAFIRRYNERFATYQGMTPPSNEETGGSLNNDYAVGSRTYNGTSPSPHAGAGGVDLAGYQTRDNMAMTRKKLLTQMVQGKGQ